MTTLTKVLIGSIPVIVVLVAAAFFTPPEFPLLARQVLLVAWAGIGIFVAEYLLFGPGVSRIATSMGLVAPRWRAVGVAIIVSVPMWLGPADLRLGDRRADGAQRGLARRSSSA